jgi:hypothetical protein
MITKRKFQVFSSFLALFGAVAALLPAAAAAGDIEVTSPTVSVPLWRAWDGSLVERYTCPASHRELRARIAPMEPLQPKFRDLSSSWVSVGVKSGETDYEAGVLVVAYTNWVNPWPQTGQIAYTCTDEHQHLG